MKKKLIVLIFFVIVIAAGIIGWKYYQSLTTNGGEGILAEGDDAIDVPLAKKELKIFNGDSRPVAVMIDNQKDAWHHSGLNNAYMVYEIIVEGGITRMMALFKDNLPDSVGPVRSARPYYIDYALENDAIYAHFGHTIQAMDDIEGLGINDIEGLYYDGTTYWREKKFAAPHNVYTSKEKLESRIADLGYRTTSTDKGFNYSYDDYNLESDKSAIELSLRYSDYQKTSYEYDADAKVYKRFMGGKAHSDYLTDEQFIAKNIIVIHVQNAALNDTREVPDKGYQKLFNIGEGTGYFFTNGEYVEITWKKDSRSAKTQYFDNAGEEIKLNDGITYVQIVPMDAKVDIVGLPVVEEDGNVVNTI